LKLPVAPLRARALLLTGLGLVLVWALHFQLMDRAHSAALAAGEASAQGLARAYAEHARATFRLIDVVSLDLRRLWVQDKASFDRQLDAYGADIGDISLQIGVADRDGMLVYSDLAVPATPVSLADREHIRVQLDSEADALFISRPVKGRVSKKWSIQFTRQVRRAGLVDVKHRRMVSRFHCHGKSSQLGCAPSQVRQLTLFRPGERPA
jgi:hypothetical protein